MATCCGRECKSSHRHLSEPGILLCLCSFIFSSSLHQAFIHSSCCGSQQLFTGNYPARAARLPSQSAFPRTVGPGSAPRSPHPSHSRPSLNLGASAPPWKSHRGGKEEGKRRETTGRDRVREWAPPQGYSLWCWHTRSVTSPLTHALAQNTRQSLTNAPAFWPAYTIEMHMHAGRYAVGMYVYKYLHMY